MNGTTRHQSSSVVSESGGEAHDTAMADSDSDAYAPAARLSGSQQDDEAASSDNPYENGGESDKTEEPIHHVIHYVRSIRRCKHRAYKSASSPVDDLRTTSIFASLSAMRSSGKFSDLSIRCGGRELKAHRVIVCSQSPVFYATLASFSDTADAVLTLHENEDDPDVFERFLEFLYTGTYTTAGTTACNKPADASMLEPAEVVEQLAKFPGIDVRAPSDQSLAGIENESYEDDSDSGTADDVQEEYEEDELEVESGTPDNGLEENNSDTPIGTENTGVANQSKIEQDAKKNLFLALRLYVMADRFEVPALQLLARDRFYRAAESWREAEWFPSVVDEIYSTVPDTDTRLREIVCRLVGASIHDDEQRGRMGPVITKHGEFALGVVNYLVEKDREVW